MADEFLKALDEVVSRAYAGESGLKLDEARARVVALYEAAVRDLEACRTVYHECFRERDEIRDILRQVAQERDELRSVVARLDPPRSVIQ